MQCAAMSDYQIYLGNRRSILLSYGVAFGRKLTLRAPLCKSPV